MHTHRHLTYTYMHTKMATLSAYTYMYMYTFTHTFAFIYTCTHRYAYTYTLLSCLQCYPLAFIVSVIVLRIRVLGLLLCDDVMVNVMYSVVHPKTLGQIATAFDPNRPKAETPQSGLVPRVDKNTLRAAMLAGAIVKKPPRIGAVSKPTLIFVLTLPFSMLCTILFA